MRVTLLFSSSEKIDFIYFYFKKCKIEMYKNCAVLRVNQRLRPKRRSIRRNKKYVYQYLTANVLHSAYVPLYCRNIIRVHFKVKVKQSHYRPWQALRIPGGLDSKIFTQSANEGGKFVSPTQRPPLPPGNIPGTHFCSRLSRPQGHSAAKRIMSVRPRGLCQWSTFKAFGNCQLFARHSPSS
jgi:hypothetical protein